MNLEIDAQSKIKSKFIINDSTTELLIQMLYVTLQKT